jgi:MFS family permease
LEESPSVTFNWKRAIAMSFGPAAFFFVWPLYNQLVPIFLQSGYPLAEQGLLLPGGEALPGGIRGFALGPAITFFIMTWDNIINIFAQPWIGARSDRTWNRFGRRKPWLLAGAPLAFLGFLFIPLAGSLPAILLAILIFNSGMALFRTPVVSWLADLFPAVQRSKANGVNGLMSGLAITVTLVGGSLLLERFGQVAPFLGGGLLMLAAAALALILVKEPPQPVGEAERTATVRQVLGALWQSEGRIPIFLLLTVLFRFMLTESLTAGISSFAIFSLGLEVGQAVRLSALTALSILLFSLPAGIIGGRFGRRRTINMALIGLFLTIAAGYFLIHSSQTLAGFLLLSGLFLAFATINELPLFYDAIQERDIGANTGIYFVAAQLAAVLGPTLAGIAISGTGSYRSLLAFAAVCALLGWVTLQRAGIVRK